MSQPNLANRSISASDKLNRNVARVEESDRNTTEEDEAVQSRAALDEQESQGLLWKLAQVSSSRQQEQVSFRITSSKTREHECLERIGQLEQALEQSLDYARELRQKLRDQHLLETQLVAAEEIANVQQQAIAELKQQLAQQQFSLARLQHARWELERERVRYIQIEQQNVALQAQIWQQYQQASEHEATVQYWKELAFQLKETIETLLPDYAVEISELPSAVQPLASIAGTELLGTKLLPFTPSKHRLSQVDLPPFLTR